MDAPTEAVGLANANPVRMYYGRNGMDIDANWDAKRGKTNLTVSKKFYLDVDLRNVGIIKVPIQSRTRNTFSMVRLVIRSDTLDTSYITSPLAAAQLADSNALRTFYLNSDNMKLHRKVFNSELEGRASLGNVLSKVSEVQFRITNYNEGSGDDPLFSAELTSAIQRGAMKEKFVFGAPILGSNMRLDHISIVPPMPEIGPLALDFDQFEEGAQVPTSTALSDGIHLSGWALSGKLNATQRADLGIRTGEYGAVLAVDYSEAFRLRVWDEAEVSQSRMRSQILWPLDGAYNIRHKIFEIEVRSMDAPNLETISFSGESTELEAILVVSNGLETFESKESFKIGPNFSTLSFDVRKLSFKRSNDHRKTKPGNPSVSKDDLLGGTTRIGIQIRPVNDRVTGDRPNWIILKSPEFKYGTYEI